MLGPKWSGPKLVHKNFGRITFSYNKMTIIIYLESIIYFLFKAKNIKKKG